MATIIQNTEFVPVVVDPPVQRTTTETKVCFFLSQRSGELPGRLFLCGVHDDELWLWVSTKLHCFTG